MSANYQKHDLASRGKSTCALKFRTAQREQRLTSQDRQVRIAAVRQCKLTPEQHERALTDVDFQVWLIAAKRKLTRFKNLDAILHHM